MRAHLREASSMRAQLKSQSRGRRPSMEDSPATKRVHASLQYTPQASECASLQYTPQVSEYAPLQQYTPQVSECASCMQ